MSTSKELRKEKRAQKKAYKKAKRKAVGLWKGLTIFFCILSILMMPVAMIAGMFDNTFAIITGDQFWKLENEDPSAVYYSGDYATTEERLTAGNDVVYQTELRQCGLRRHRLR